MAGEGQTPEDREREEKLYLAERHSLTESEHKSADEFAKYLFFSGAGSLGLSLTFLRDVVGTKTANALPALIVSWVTLALSLIIALLSIFLSIYAFRRQRDIIESAYENKGTICNAPGSNVWSCAVSSANVVALLLFLVGLGAMLTFALWNL